LESSKKVGGRTHQQFFAFTFYLMKPLIKIRCDQRCNFTMVAEFFLSGRIFFGQSGRIILKAVGYSGAADTHRHVPARPAGLQFSHHTHAVLL
jgi:hypothetical protein